ncbi:claudin-10 [Archocentrus centrarchus]|uniref:claudin-10 n=1 Tax=Archocentrus centrarchus TaxID=63155 RepID=UPI0011E9DE7F|nr:claudin-10-like [Archocentrus centrarchus]
MKIRVVQIWGFLMTVLGWIFVACTLAMEGWKIASVGGMGGSAIIKVAWHWTSLWRSCFTDSTAVSNCRDFPVLWSVDGNVQIVRALLMSALSLGVLGFVLSLLGMECTYIGGKEPSKYRKIYTGGWCHIVSGVLSTSGYGVYAQNVSAIHVDPGPTGLQFDLGTPVFLGLVGSAFHMTGGAFYLWSVCTPLCGGQKMVINVQELPDPKQNKSTTALSTVSEITSKTKLSSVSDMSFESEGSDFSSISSSSRRTAKSGRLLKTGRTTSPQADLGSRSGLNSDLSLRSSLSGLSESRSGRSSQRSGAESSMSGTYRSATTPFIKRSYI